jgi:hypothetical protein
MLVSGLTGTAGGDETKAVEDDSERHVWRTDTELLQALAKSPAGQAAGLKISSLKSIVGTWQKGVEAAMAFAPPPAPAPALAPAPAPAPPPPPPYVPVRDTNLHNTLRVPTLRAFSPVADVLEGVRPPSSSPEPMAFEEPGLDGPPNLGRKVSAMGTLEFSQRSKQAYNKAITRRGTPGTPDSSSPMAGSPKHDHSLGELPGSPEMNEESQVDDGRAPLKEWSVRNGKSSSDRSPTKNGGGGERSPVRCAMVGGAGDAQAERMAETEKARVAPSTSADHDDGADTLRGATGGRGVAISEGVLRSPSSSELSNFDVGERVSCTDNGARATGFSISPTKANPRHRGRSIEVAGPSRVEVGSNAFAGFQSNTVSDIVVGEPPTSLEPNPVAPIADNDARDQLRALIATWDALPKPAWDVINGAPHEAPLITTPEEDAARRQLSMSRTARAVAAAERAAAERAAKLRTAAVAAANARVAADRAEMLRARASLTAQIASRCPTTAPRPPRSAPVSARSPRSASIQGIESSSVRLPLRQSLRSISQVPLRTAMVDNWMLNLEQCTRLTQWWTEEGSYSSPASVTLPLVLSKRGMAMEAFAEGQLAMRAGFELAAARHFRQAAQLLPEQPALRWRLRDAESQLMR